MLYISCKHLCEVRLPTINYKAIWPRKKLPRGCSTERIFPSNDCDILPSHPKCQDSADLLGAFNKSLLLAENAARAFAWKIRRGLAHNQIKAC